MSPIAANPTVNFTPDVSRRANSVVSKFIAPLVVRDRSIGIVDSVLGIGPIGRLRYDLFIERDGKAYEFADHDQRSFIEPIDSCSLNFHFSNDDQCLAAVRLSWAEDALADNHLKLVVENSGIETSLFPQMLVTSRMAIRDQKIAKQKMVALIQEACFIGVLSGARYSCVGCRPTLARLFEKMGFEFSGSRYVDHVAGFMTVMVLDISKASYLRSLGSPFLGNAYDYQAQLKMDRG